MYAGILANRGSMSGCITTEVCSVLNNQNTSCQTNPVSPATISIAPLPCPTEGVNEPSLMEGAFSSLDRLDSSDLRELTTMMEDSEQVLSANLSASLQLADCSSSNKLSNEVIAAQESLNMSDSFDRIANNTLNEFCEIYTKPN